MFESVLDDCYDQIIDMDGGWNDYNDLPKSRPSWD